MKTSGVYQVVNTITGDFYIGSSVDLDRREKEHFNENYWKQNQNKPLYKYMQQYGKDNFLFKPIWLCDPKELKKYEQIAIDKYNPKYNVFSAYTGMSKEEDDKQYRKEHADSIKQYRKEHADSIKQYRKEHADSIKQYNNQQCLYENEIINLNALRVRFARQGIEHPTLEAKKYLIKLP